MRFQKPWPEQTREAACKAGAPVLTAPTVLPDSIIPRTVCLLHFFLSMGLRAVYLENLVLIPSLFV